MDVGWAAKGEGGSESRDTALATSWSRIAARTFARRAADAPSITSAAFQKGRARREVGVNLVRQAWAGTNWHSPRGRREPTFEAGLLHEAGRGLRVAVHHERLEHQISEHPARWPEG